MALVAYENSDSSDYEEETNNYTAISSVNTKTEIKHVPDPTVSKPVTTIEDEQELQPEQNELSLFNFLPQPSKQKPAVIEEDDEFLHKKEITNAVKPKARITVPSLNDFKDVKDSPVIVKPRAPADKKSSLLSMLPQPRNGVKSTTVSLIPQVLKRKPEAPVKKAPLPTPPKKCKVDSTPLVNEYSDESDNEDLQNDFFSIHKPVEIPDDVQLPLDIDQNTKKPNKPKGIESFFKKEDEIKHVVLEPDYDQSMEEQAGGSSYDDATDGAEGSNNDVLLNEEAIMKLCGARGKRKREEIQIVDVNQAEVLADAREMLMKGLMDDTTKRVSASKKKGNEPTTQQRRKHQITYLAYQAKANEAELQNQWANNRMSKRQTQAKYGF